MIFTAAVPYTRPRRTDNERLEVTMRPVRATLLALLMAAAACSSEPRIDGKSVYDWIALLRHEDWTQQERARDALARLGEPAFPYLKRALAGNDPAVKRGSIIALSRMGKKARPMVPVLLRVLRREKIDALRAEILRALLVIDPGDPRVVETFKKRLRDRAEQVRDLAAKGLEAGKPKPEGKKKEDVAGRKRFALRREIGDRLGGKPFALVAELHREELRLAVVWIPNPAGKSQMQALLFRKTSDGWRPEGEPVGVPAEGGTELFSKMLEGHDKQVLVKPCGVEKSRITAHLADTLRRLQQARQAGDAASMAAAFEKLSVAVSYRALVLGGIGERMLAEKALADGVKDAAFEEHGQAIVLGKYGTMQLVPCGDGVAIAGWTISATGEEKAKKEKREGEK